MLTTIVSFIIAIGIIIFIHEFGHFLAAKLSGVRVEVFSLGFPPKIFSRKMGETEYQLAWIPLGGYVKMSGMIDESFDEDFDPNDPRGFMSQPLIRRVFILVAGVLMNILLGFAIYSAVTWYSGVGKMTGTTVTMVSPDYPAAEAGLKPGDNIFEVNGEAVKDWTALTEAIRGRAGIPTLIRWQRGDSIIAREIVPRPTPDIDLNTMETDTVGKIGVVGSFVTESVGPFSALKYGAIEVWWVLKMSWKTLIALVSGKAKIDQVMGPIGILKMSGDTARGGFISFVSFIAMVSVSIGFLNIMPIPMLDGGHLIFILIEAVIGRPLSGKLKYNLMKVGLAALLLFITIVSYHDILRLFRK